jgi:hypothetical protein
MRNGSGFAACAAVALVAGLLVAEAAAQTVNNGNFETDAGLFTAGPGYVDQPGNPGEITGWTGSSDGGYGINGPTVGFIFSDNGNNLSSVLFIQETGKSLTQSVSGFTPVAQQYQLDFDYNHRQAAAGGGTLTITLGDGSFVDLDIPPVGGSNPWYHGSFTFLAAAPAQTLTITKGHTVAVDNTVLVDNLVITAVPEPATLMLLGMSGLLLRPRWQA